MVDNIAVTPEVVTALGRVAAKWHVQSSDVDNRLDEFPSLERGANSGSDKSVRKTDQGVWIDENSLPLIENALSDLYFSSKQESKKQWPNTAYRKSAIGRF